MTDERLIQHRLLRHGDRGEEVQRLQQLLDGALDRPLIADGIFGSRTQEAVRTFQARHGLVVDGIVGPATWGKLEHDTHPGEPAMDFEGDHIEVLLPPPPTFEESERGGELLEQILQEVVDEATMFAAVSNEWALHDSTKEGQEAFLRSATDILGAGGSPKRFLRAGTRWIMPFLREWVFANQVQEITALRTSYYDAFARGFMAGLHGEQPPEGPSNPVLRAVQQEAFDRISAFSHEDRRAAIAFLLRKGDAHFVLRPEQSSVTQERWRVGLRARSRQRTGLLSMIHFHERSR